MMAISTNRPVAALTTSKSERFNEGETEFISAYK
jgi:hypothetical protein